MMRLLEFICQLLKWSLWLTLLRLVTTAFNLEFGVSRRYLRLLEWLLERGEQRIAKVDSDHKMQHLEELTGQLMNWNETNHETQRISNELLRKPPGSLNFEQYGAGALHGNLRSNWKDEKENVNELDKQINRSNVQRKSSPLLARKVSLSKGHSEFSSEPSQENGKSNEIYKLHSDTAKGQQHKQQQQQQKRRRVSTPDGPPVFLLDDDDNDDDDDKQEEGEEEDGQSIVRGKQDVSTRTSIAKRDHKQEFHLDDAARFVVKGVSVICDDEVTKRFTTEQLKTWNLLTRTNAKNYQFMSRSLGIYWFCGLLIRYFILMPLRIMFTIAGTLWLITTMSLIGLLIPRRWRNMPFKLMSLMSFRMLSCGITSRLSFHNLENRARNGDICVANHTSPIDVVLLSCDNCYALVGQRHGGLLGLLEMALSRATNHVWFDRTEMRDRQLVSQRLKQHVSVKSNLPVLIFPEGTCINNSAVMMFRKGSFETSARICPVAIKYDSRFGDPFWNSAKQSYLEYLLMMMSSWAIKCDVWYLAPMERLSDESSAEFANRVKAAIAKQAGLEDLAWDGQLKRSSVKPTWLYQQQEDYVKRLKLE